MNLPTCTVPSPVNRTKYTPVDKMLTLIVVVDSVISRSKSSFPFRFKMVRVFGSDVSVILMLMVVNEGWGKLL